MALFHACLPSIHISARPATLPSIIVPPRSWIRLIEMAHQLCDLTMSNAAAQQSWG